MTASSVSSAILSHCQYRLLSKVLENQSWVDNNPVALFSPVILLLCPLPGVWGPQQAWHGCCLPTCEIPARWIFPHRHMSHEPSVGAHERSHRPIASVKSVDSAALWVSDPSLPHIPTTTSELPPNNPTLTPNMPSSTPPSSWASYANLNLSHCASVQHGCCLGYDLPSDSVGCWGQRILLSVKGW